MRKPVSAALVAILFVACPFGSTSLAAVKPHSLFSDGMVLQRGMSVPVWGTADDGEKVTVRFAGQEVSTTVKNGKWMVHLKPLKVGGPAQMTIRGETTIQISDVLVGEVWACSGQSNMAFAVAYSAGAKQAIAASANPMIRLLTVPRTPLDEPASDVPGLKWSECGPETVKGFSAVGYFFGRDLQQALDVPIGLINTSVGGTPAEAWTSRKALRANPAFQAIFDRHAKAVENYPQAVKRYEAALAKYKETAAKAKQEGSKPPQKPRAPWNPSKSPHRPSGLYNGMISPLIPYAIRGAIWYQGESNANRAYEYRTLFPAMITNWRQDWGQGDFPFLFVQLAPFGRWQKPTWPELREAQLLTTVKLPNTAMAVITDVGDEKDIHPKQKGPVGARLALAARALAYGENIVYSGPVYNSMKIDGDKAILSFKHVGKGLFAKGGPLTGFTIAGEDRKFVDADAEIRGDTIVVSSPDVTKPAAVRYGWANFPVVNLWNKDGLPATPFRTDDFPMITKP